MHRLTWLCTTRRHYALAEPLIQRFSSVAQGLRRAGFRRLRCERWVRYRIPLSELPPCDEPVTLHVVDAELMARLAHHPERDEPQLRSARRFWEGGFARGYVWLDQGEPLSIIWLIRGVDESHRSHLGIWAGMYPPLPASMGILEGIYTFRRALRRRGGAATPFTGCVLHEARRAGLTEVRTHVHVDNIAAHRWARRVGLQAYGMIYRYVFDLPGLREGYFYLHTLDAAPALGLAPAAI